MGFETNRTRVTEPRSVAGFFRAAGQTRQRVQVPAGADHAQPERPETRARRGRRGLALDPALPQGAFGLRNPLLENQGCRIPFGTSKPRCFEGRPRGRHLFGRVGAARDRELAGIGGVRLRVPPDAGRSRERSGATRPMTLAVLAPNLLHVEPGLGLDAKALSQALTFAFATGGSGEAFTRILCQGKLAPSRFHPE